MKKILCLLTIISLCSCATPESYCEENGHKFTSYDSCMFYRQRAIERQQDAFRNPYK